MSIAEEAAAQLAAELGGAARALTDILGTDLAEIVEQRLDGRCALLAAELASDDDHLAAEATLSVMCARWPDGTEPPPQWWRTPVGRLVARSAGRDDTDAVSHSVAAAMLGVARGTVAQMMSRAGRGLGGSGGLERHPDGGITRASVLARLARHEP